MGTVLFVSHPEVVVDPGIPVPRWRLADGGIRRMRAFAEAPALKGLASVWASRETKAIEAAGLLAGRFGLSVHVHEGLGENDRSATGFLPPDEFERVADAFFASPHESVRGWERAADAQARVAEAADAILACAPDGDVALVAHGGVGTLLLCLYAGVPTAREHDQPFQGHYFAFDRGTRRVLHPWRSIAPR
jgi:broad specificity phosphatase PhoE